MAAEKSMVRKVRHFASSLLASWGVAVSDQESALLIVGELGANAARHGGAEVAVCLLLRGRTLRIAVRDSGPLPSARPAGEGGRGLTIVGHLAHRVETTVSEQGRTVRAELRLTAPALCGGR
ncbi:ATP-binding protein [Streptomyces sanyensis]|uniref:ATP-binding protein n=1 Tax=Streptomyces sanyensis TaxID=568869 RepID=UPI003D76CC4E